jgi:hypothetical protein
MQPHRVIDWPALEREALRLHARYTAEVVEACGLCPWAEQARIEGRVATRVCGRDGPDVGDALRILDALAHEPQIEVGFIVFPALELDRLAFAHFVADVRARDAALRGAGKTVFALADFHPQAAADVRSPERLVPFLRRTPDPTIQLVRHTALHAVRLSADQGTSFIDLSQLSEGQWTDFSAPIPPLAARVAKNNLRTVERMGAHALAARIESILEDRQASYFALGLPLPLRQAPT